MTSAVLDSRASSLLSATAVRERSRNIADAVIAGQSRHFRVDRARLDEAASLVARVTRERYPDLAIPYHSRWRHIEAGGIDRRALLPRDPHAHVDLTVVSVLLDAGAGPDWHYDEAQSRQRFTRSEGLGVASWHAFSGGVFSSDPATPRQADAAGLRRLDLDRLADAFQVGRANPLVGLAGRVAVLHRLGDALAAAPEVFGSDGRPGGLFDVVVAKPGPVTASDLLSHVLTSFASIWPSRNVIGDEPVGDCWRHAAVPGPGLTAGWVPFHKLSQWLTYSLLEPFGRAGVHVADLDALTGLPEYRNGGLLLDTGALVLRDPDFADRTWAVGDELVVEWRALTVTLLDELAPMVRARLGVDEHRMPLACVLEGGTWAAGRALAQRLRGGLPPLSIDSDGTVF